MTLNLKTRVILGRDITGGAGMKEFLPHAAWFQAGLDMGIIKGSVASSAPTDKSLYWFDTTDTAQTPGGSIKKWTGTVWARNDTLTGGAVGGGVVDAMPLFLASPTNTQYQFFYQCPYPFVLTDLSGITASGTCTIQVTRNGTAVGTACYVNSVPGAHTAQADVQFVAGDTVGLVVTSNSAAVNLAATMVIARII